MIKNRLYGAGQTIRRDAGGLSAVTNGANCSGDAVEVKCGGVVKVVIIFCGACAFFAAQAPVVAVLR